MRHTNRSLARRGSKRRLGAIKARDYWSRDMTVLCVVVLGLLVLIFYSFF